MALPEVPCNGCTSCCRIDCRTLARRFDFTEATLMDRQFPGFLVVWKRGRELLRMGA